MWVNRIRLGIYYALFYFVGGVMKMDKYLNSIVKRYMNHASFEDANVSMNMLKIYVIGITYTLFECVGLILSSLGYFDTDIRGP
jgi:hypothetical protein